MQRKMGIIRLIKPELSFLVLRTENKMFDTFKEVTLSAS